MDGSPARTCGDSDVEKTTFRISLPLTVGNRRDDASRKSFPDEDSYTGASSNNGRTYIGAVHATSAGLAEEGLPKTQARVFPKSVADQALACFRKLGLLEADNVRNEAFQQMEVRKEGRDVQGHHSESGSRARVRLDTVREEKESSNGGEEILVSRRVSVQHGVGEARSKHFPPDILIVMH